MGTFRFKRDYAEFSVEGEKFKIPYDEKTMRDLTVARENLDNIEKELSTKSVSDDETIQAFDNLMCSIVDQFLGEGSYDRLTKDRDIVEKQDLTIFIMGEIGQTIKRHNDKNIDRYKDKDAKKR